MAMTKEDWEALAKLKEQGVTQEQLLAYANPTPTTHEQFNAHQKANVGDWSNASFEDQLAGVTSGTWTNNDMGSFFDLVDDTTLPDETRRAIAKAKAERYDMPYIDPLQPFAPSTDGLALGSSPYSQLFDFSDRQYTGPEGGNNIEDGWGNTNWRPGLATTDDLNAMIAEINSPNQVNGQQQSQAALPDGIIKMYVDDRGRNIGIDAEGNHHVLYGDETSGYRTLNNLPDGMLGVYVDDRGRTIGWDAEGNHHVLNDDADTLNPLNAFRNHDPGTGAYSNETNDKVAQDFYNYVKKNPEVYDTLTPQEQIQYVHLQFQNGEFSGNQKDDRIKKIRQKYGLPKENYDGERRYILRNKPDAANRNDGITPGDVFGIGDYSQTDTGKDDGLAAQIINKGLLGHDIGDVLDIPGIEALAAAVSPWTYGIPLAVVEGLKVADGQDFDLGTAMAIIYAAYGITAPAQTTITGAGTTGIPDGAISLGSDAVGKAEAARAAEQAARAAAEAGGGTLTNAELIDAIERGAVYYEDNDYTSPTKPNRRGSSLTEEELDALLNPLDEPYQPRTDVSLDELLDNPPPVDGPAEDYDRWLIDVAHASQEANAANAANAANGGGGGGKPGGGQPGGGNNNPDTGPGSDNPDGVTKERSWTYVGNGWFVDADGNRRYQEDHEGYKVGGEYSSGEETQPNTDKPTGEPGFIWVNGDWQWDGNGDGRPDSEQDGDGTWTPEWSPEWEPTWTPGSGPSDGAGPPGPPGPPGPGDKPGDEPDDEPDDEEPDGEEPGDTEKLLSALGLGGMGLLTRTTESGPVADINPYFDFGTIRAEPENTDDIISLLQNMLNNGKLTTDEFIAKLQELSGREG